MVRAPELVLVGNAQPAIGHMLFECILSGSFKGNQNDAILEGFLV